MSIGNKLQITKAATHRVLTSKESAFLFATINTTGDMDKALVSINAWSGKNREKMLIMDGFSFSEHVKLSTSILSKVKDEIITLEDLEEIKR